MSELRHPPADLPTLTEIIAEGAAPASAGAVVLPLPVRDAGLAAARGLDEDALFLEVLDELRTQVDRMLDFRLRQALAPVVEKAVGQLVHDAKQELHHTLEDVLRRSVAQVIARNRPR